MFPHGAEGMIFRGFDLGTSVIRDRSGGTQMVLVIIICQRTLKHGQPEIAAEDVEIWDVHE